MFATSINNRLCMYAHGLRHIQSKYIQMSLSHSSDLKIATCLVNPAVVLMHILHNGYRRKTFVLRLRTTKTMKIGTSQFC